MPYPPHRIKYLLEEAGYTITRLAKENGFKIPEVSMCINGTRIYPPIRIAICRVINKPVETVFGAHPSTTALLEGRDVQQPAA